MVNDQFIYDIKQTLRKNLQVDFADVPDRPFYTVFFGEHSLAVQFIPINKKKLSAVTSDYFVKAIEQYDHKSIRLINIWEDVWWNKKEIVLSRFDSLMGTTKRIHGRQTIVKRIDKKTADVFLNTHHLIGSANAKYKYGLFYKNILVAVASFSGGRTMTRSVKPYRSYEMISFANAMGVTVTGGLSKLLNAFSEEVRPDDIMTYIDRDWSDGSSYKRLGFKLKEVTKPQMLWVNEKEKIRYYPHRLPENFDENSYFKIYNSGNLKFSLQSSSLQSAMIED
jgi:hypothetical protein